MAVLPRSFMDCVVALGARDRGGTVRWTGSGFLVAERQGDGSRERVYRTYLVSNRHVFAQARTAFARFNAAVGEATRQFKVELDPEQYGRLVFPHPNPEVDVAVVPVSADELARHGVRFAFFKSDEHVLTRAAAKDAGLAEGDPVLVLGFPMGLVGDERNHVIVRQGCLARVCDAFDGEAHSFLLDASVYPGNSGGPVVSRPAAVGAGGDDARLLGVVSRFLAYQDVAVSQQTGQQRIVFVENSGLAVAFSYDAVQEAIREHWKALGEGPAGATLVEHRADGTRRPSDGAT
jgi:hypothetical protein